jgi:LytS/YehU family sensor histidine kinase
LIRNVLDISRQNTVSISKDLETLQLYLDLESFRQPDKFIASIHADQELLQGDYQVPPLIAQPYVENAILHGLRGRKDKQGKLEVSVTRDNHHILYSIQDNGVGRARGKHESKNENGYGMQMSSDRIRLFNDEETASVHITDLIADGQPSGTRVIVQLKIQ